MIVSSNKKAQQAAVASADLESIGYKQELKRALTLKDLIIFGLIGVLPIAPIQVYGDVSIGTNGLAPLVYVIGVVCMIFTAFSYNSLTKEFPATGASYMFVSHTISPHVGFLAGWLIMVDYILVPSVLVCFGAEWMTNLLPGTPMFLWILLFVCIITAINIKGIQTTAGTDMIMLGLEFLCIALFLFFAIKFVFVDGGGYGGWSIKPFWNAEVVDFKFIGGACSIAVFGFLGFDGVTALSEEAANPRRDMGRSIIATLVIIGGLFMLQSYFATLAHPSYEDLDPVMAFFDICREVGGPFLYFLFVIVGIIAVSIANALVLQTSVSRIMFSMGRDKVLPFSGFFGKVNAKTKTPVNAILVVAAVTLVVANVGIGVLLELVSFAALTTFLVINVSVVVYFWGKQKRRGTKEFFEYLLSPCIGFLVVMFIWVQYGAIAYILGGSWLFIGFIIGLVKSKGYKIVPAAMASMGGGNSLEDAIAEDFSEAKNMEE